MNLIHNIKKNIVAVLGMAMMIGLSVWSLTSEGNENSKAEVKQASMYWYPVNPATNQTSSAAAFHDTKDNVVNAQDCKDDPNEPICLYGSTNPSLPVGTNIGTPTDANRILESH